MSENFLERLLMTKSPMKERFWRWAYNYCDRNLRETYLQRVGWNIKCPDCRTWSHVAGIQLVSWNEYQSRYECGACHKVTAWEFHGMNAVSVPTVYWQETIK